MTYGYVRVSTRDQNEARQIIAMQERGVELRHIYTDKQSGKDFNRPEYQRLLRKLRPGDVLIVKSNGGTSSRTRAVTSSCWTCRCWTLRSRTPAGSWAR